MTSAAFAGTATNVSISGVPIPGKQIIIIATLTGNHIVWNGPGSVPAGPMKFYANGGAIGQAMPNDAQSTGVYCNWITDPVFNRVCHASTSKVGMPFTIPKGAKSVSIYAHYDGDADSDGSSSPSVTIATRRPSIAPVVNMLFDQ